MKVSNEQDRLYDLICVDRPYFALQNLEVISAGAVSATVEFESDNEYEQGLSTAEIGRHLAILGSCALASLNDSQKKNFYLTTLATGVRFHYSVSKGNTYFITARGKKSSKRAGQAQMELRATNGQLLAEMTTEYSVVPSGTFERLYKDYRQETNHVSSPYTQPMPVVLTELSENLAKANINKIDSRYCAGHFAQYPALPVAMLMEVLNRLVGQHLKKCFGGSTFYCLECISNANNLVFAGQSISFEIRKIRNNGRKNTYLGLAYNSEDRAILYGEMEITYLQVNTGEKVANLLSGIDVQLTNIRA